MNSSYVIYWLFVIFGLGAIIYPKKITLEEIENSYETQDINRGWGIYSVTIGALLIFPALEITILRLCFISSILWHLFIIIRSGWTLHHKHSIIANLVVFFLTFMT